MGKSLNEVSDEIMELLRKEEVSFPWLFVAEDIDDEIAISIFITNIDTIKMPSRVNKIEGIYRYSKRLFERS